MKFNSSAYDKIFPREEVKKPIVTEDDEDSMIKPDADEKDEKVEDTINEDVKDEGGTDDGDTGNDNPSTE